MLTVKFADGATGGVLVDWLTISTEVLLAEGVPAQHRPIATMRATCATLGFDWAVMPELHDVRPVKSAQGWNESYSAPQASMRVDTRGSGKCLASWSGQGCAWLRKVGRLDAMLALGERLASRVDVAFDRPMTAMPTNLVDITDTERPYMLSLWRSKEGETVYLGSMSSNKFARLYKYTEAGHEREGVMRLEVVFRDKQAQRICKTVREGKIMSIVHSEAERLGLLTLLDGAHIDRQDLERISSYVKSRNPNTIKWIETAVIPALLRLENDGDVADGAELISLLLAKARAQAESPD